MVKINLYLYWLSEGEYKVSILKMILDEIFSIFISEFYCLKVILIMIRMVIGFLNFRCFLNV